jgi:predicted MPP superfamily phosphohydrolase
MSLFFLTFFSIYGGVHVYAFLKARTALGFGWASGVVLVAFMLVMTMAPVLIRVLEQNGYELGARVLSYVAYVWMAVLFLFFCGALVIDLLNLLPRLIGLMINMDLSPLQARPKLSFFLSLGIALGVSAYGYFDALNIRTERLVLETQKLPAGVDRLTIVQISDVHLGLIVRSERLDLVLDKVRAEKPDILVSTGDLVDGQINHMTGLAERLRALSPKYGKFSITGNHEYYAGLEQALAFTRKAGFTLLRGESTTGVINIVGVDDPTGVQMKIERLVSEKALLSRLPKGRFTLFLKHRPVIDQEALGLFDLQLSGHTHKGQIWPFTYLSGISYPLSDGRFDLAKGSILYVSRGTGTWGPPIRFLSPPQITVIELVRKTPR